MKGQITPNRISDNKPEEGPVHSVHEVVGVEARALVLRVEDADEGLRNLEFFVLKVC